MLSTTGKLASLSYTHIYFVISGSNHRELATLHTPLTSQNPLKNKKPPILQL